MSERCLVQFIPVRLPPGHMMRKNFSKPIIMPFFNQMSHLMQDDIINTLFRFFDHLQIDKDPPGLRVTTPPFGLHFPDTKGFDRYPKVRFPFFYTSSNYLFEFVPVPFGEDLFSSFSGRSRTDKQDHPFRLVDSDTLSSFPFLN